MPPPHGSASTRIASDDSVAIRASAVANTEAPAPPRPAMTATTAPRRAVLECRLRGVRQLGHQIVVAGRQRDDVLCAHRDGRLPVGGPRLGAYPPGPRDHAVAVHAGRSAGRPVHRAARRPRPPTPSCSTARMRGRPALLRPRRRDRRRRAALGSPISARIPFVEAMQPTLRAATDTAPAAWPGLWMNPNMGIDGVSQETKTTFRNLGRMADLSAMRKAP